MIPLLLTMLLSPALVSPALASTALASTAQAADWRAELDSAIAQAPADQVTLAAEAQVVTTRAGGLRLIDLGAEFGPVLAADRLLSGDDSPEVRVAIAAATTARIHEWPEIAVGLVDVENDPAVRAMLLGGLQRVDGALALPRLQAALTDADLAVRTEAAAVIGRHSDGAELGPALITALTDTDPQVRALSARALGRHQVSNSFAPLVATLADSDADVRLRSLRALTRIDPVATAALTEVLALQSDPDSRIVRAATQLR